MRGCDLGPLDTNVFFGAGVLKKRETRRVNSAKLTTFRRPMSLRLGHIKEEI
jgi:hypothetical protein